MGVITKRLNKNGTTSYALRRKGFPDATKPLPTSPTPRRSSGRWNGRSTSVNYRTT